MGQEAKRWRAGDMVMSRKAWAALNDESSALTIVQDGVDVIACVWAESDDDEAAYARLIAAAPELADAAHFAKAALAALEGYEADYGEPLDDMHELGRIEDSRATPSFRIRVGHIRALAAAFAKSEAR